MAPWRTTHHWCLCASRLGSTVSQRHPGSEEDQAACSSSLFNDEAKLCSTESTIKVKLGIESSTLLVAPRLALNGIITIMNTIQMAVLAQQWRSGLRRTDRCFTSGGTPNPVFNQVVSLVETKTNIGCLTFFIGVYL